LANGLAFRDTFLASNHMNRAVDGVDGVFGRPACPSPKVEVLRFRLMINVVCVGAATSIRWRSAA
jgi:hypothetical protein